MKTFLSLLLFCAGLSVYAQENKMAAFMPEMSRSIGVSFQKFQILIIHLFLDLFQYILEIIIWLKALSLAVVALQEYLVSFLDYQLIISKKLNEGEVRTIYRLLIIKN